MKKFFFESFSMNSGPKRLSIHKTTSIDRLNYFSSRDGKNEKHKVCFPFGAFNATYVIMEWAVKLETKAGIN